jgi:tetratricopeptide (TPR) repeat protein
MSVPTIQTALRLLEEEKVPTAISRLERTVRERPAHLPALILLARAYEYADEWEQALQTWEDARFLMPNSPTVQTGRKRALRRIDEPEASSDDERETAPQDDARETTGRPESPASGPPASDTGSPAPATDPAASETDASEPEAPPASASSRGADADPESGNHLADEDPTKDEAAGETPGADDATVSEEPAPPEERRPEAEAPSTETSTSAGEEPPNEEVSAKEEVSPEEGASPVGEPEGKDEAQPEDDRAGSIPGIKEPDGEGGMPSGLEQLRRQAEQEARQGGARPGLAQQQAAASADEPDETAEQEADDVTGDLDRLIRELESARIEPTPEPSDPEEDPEVDAPDLEDDIDDLVSETLARIYAGQEQYRQAAQIYVKLAAQEPDRARHHLQNAAEMREKADAQEAAQAEETDGAQ